MANLRNFINVIANDNRIYTAEDIGKMTSKEFLANEKAIDYQLNNLGIPRESDLVGNPDVVYVHGYTRDDGTEVRAHYRSKPDGVVGNNYQMDGVATGGASNVDNFNIKYSEIRNIDPTSMKPTNFSQLETTNPFAKINAEKNANRPDARELMNISLSGFKNLPEHPEFKVFQPEAAEYVNKVLNIKDSKDLVIPANWHGVIYDKNSGFGKRLSKSSELQTQVMAAYDNTTRKFKKDRITIEFKQDKNLNYSIGHGTILNPRIENGEFKGILFDKYDYDLLIKEYLDNPKITFYNNAMAVMQHTPLAENYYVIIPIKFGLTK